MLLSKNIQSLKNASKNNLLQFDVDLVYTWVDGSDPAWRAKHDRFAGIAPETHSGEDCRGRYVSNDELKFSLRAAEKYAPWIRNIYIVTDNQVPDWLDTSNPRIHIVDHSEILPSESLPTFNSSVIEHSLYRIPGLAEHFLYANDDMFFNRPVEKSDFFTPDGRAIARLNRRLFRKTFWKLREKLFHKTHSYYNKSVMKSARLVEKRFGRFYGDKPHHNIDAYLKSNLMHVREDLFRDEIDKVMGNHLRIDSDIQRVLYLFAAIAEGKALRKYVSRSTSFHVHIHNPTHLNKLERIKPMLFCVNDSQYASDDDRRRVRAFLEKRFPEMSHFEL